MVDEDINVDKLQLFREVIDLLNNSNITYWMDQGSLLGLIRDNRFMSWDHDVDIGIWKEDAPKLKKLLDEEILPNGGRISSLPYVVKIKKRYNVSVKNIPVNIRIYYKKDEHAYSEFWSIMNVSNKVKKKLNEEYLKNLTRVGRRISRASLASKGSAVHSVKKGILRFLFKLLLSMREVLKTRRILFRVDSKFFSNFKLINLYNLELSVPEEAEEYLLLKYGTDWKVPNTSWEWWKDDGAVYKTDYYFLNLKGLLYLFYR